MGMFDNISVADELPFSEEMLSLGLNKNNLTFQTKCLDCILADYIIQDKKLFIQKYKEERWTEGNKDSKNFIDRIGFLERNDPYYEQVFHHGEIYFYESIQNVQEKWDCWVEYKAVFSKGNLENIILVKFEKSDNTERKKSEQEWKERWNREQNIWYNKFFFNTKSYRWFSHKIWYRTCYELGNFFHKISHKL